MEYHLYRSDALGNIKTYYCSFVEPINESPFDVALRNLSNNISNSASFDSKYNPVTKSLFITMFIPHAMGGEQKRFQYFILSKEAPSEMWEIVLLGDIRREGDQSQISFYVGPDDDPVEKATSVLRRLLENSNSKITASSSFKHGTMHYEENMDISVVYEFRTQFDGKTQTNIVNVYQVNKVY